MLASDSCVAFALLSLLLLGTKIECAHSFATIVPEGRSDGHAQLLEVDRSHLPQHVKDSLDEYGYAYYCKACAVGFSKEKNYRQHVAGRKHHQIQAEEATAWQDFVADCPTWLDDEQTVQGTVDVKTQWRESEFAAFPHDHSCIQTSLTILDLSLMQRARFWRYLRDSFGRHFAELPQIFHHMSLHSPQYLRVKELFETCEAFKLIGDLIAKDDESIDCIYDLACGHGLLGILLAYRFPRKRVICMDLVERESHHAFQSAFVEVGESCGSKRPLSNLEYRVADLMSVDSDVTRSSFLIALHACNEANKNVADIARSVGAGWAVMPCCIRSGMYLNGASVLGFSSEDRYKFFCGVFAETNDANVVRTISRDITARPIIISGWNRAIEEPSGKEGNDTLPPRLLKMGGMPPLNQ